jgi:hypothetical protein
MNIQTTAYPGELIWVKPPSKPHGTFEEQAPPLFRLSPRIQAPSNKGVKAPVKKQPMAIRKMPLRAPRIPRPNTGGYPYVTKHIHVMMYKTEGGTWVKKIRPLRPDEIN